MLLLKADLSDAATSGCKHDAPLGAPDLSPLVIYLAAEIANLAGPDKHMQLCFCDSRHYNIRI